MKEVFVWQQTSHVEPHIENLVKNFNMKVVDREPHNLSFFLVANEDRLSLSVPKLTGYKPWFVDFSSGEFQFMKKKGVKRSDLLAKSIGFKGKPLQVFDATAGWMHDSFYFYCLGCNVVVCEENLIVYCLLKNAIERASKDKGLLDFCLRVSLQFGPAEEVLQQEIESKRFDVVFFDPMFEQRQKSALPSKSMQYMQALLGEYEESHSKTTALALQRKGGCRLVIKRGKNNQPLVAQPQLQKLGKAIRYDIYLPSVN